MKKKGQRRLVLTEEDYTSKLSSIVARDYYPDVSKLQRENALLDRRLEGDAAGAIAVRRASRRLIETQEVAAAQRERDDFELVELRADTKSAKRLVRKRPRPLAEETITGFVARATNEDDDEFDSNLRQDLKAKRKMVAGLYGSQKITDCKKSSEKIYNRLLEMASDDFAPESNTIEWKKPNMRNTLFFNPTPMNTPSHLIGNATLGQNLLKDSVTSSHSSKDGRLMPPPSKQQTTEIISMKFNEKNNCAFKSKSELVEYVPKHMLEKKIEPSATRFPSEESSFVPSIGCNMNGIMTEEIDSDSDTDCVSYTTGASTDLDVPLKPVEEERHLFQSTERSGQRSYVTMAPQNIPGAVNTWGKNHDKLEVASRPDNPKESSSLSMFRMSSKTKRECAASRAELVLTRRAKLLSSSKSNKRRSNVKLGRSSSLSPAAISLLQKTKSTRPKSEGAFVSALRTSYTPRLNPPSSSSSSLSHSRKGSKVRRRDHVYNGTPKI